MAVRLRTMLRRVVAESAPPPLHNRRWVFGRCVVVGPGTRARRMCRAGTQRAPRLLLQMLLGLGSR